MLYLYTVNISNTAYILSLKAHNSRTQRHKLLKTTNKRSRKQCKSNINAEQRNITSDYKRILQRNADQLI